MDIYSFSVVAFTSCSCVCFVLFFFSYKKKGHLFAFSFAILALFPALLIQRLFVKSRGQSQRNVALFNVIVSGQVNPQDLLQRWIMHVYINVCFLQSILCVSFSVFFNHLILPLALQLQVLLLYISEIIFFTNYEKKVKNCIVFFA